MLTDEAKQKLENEAVGGPIVRRLLTIAAARIEIREVLEAHGLDGDLADELRTEDVADILRARRERDGITAPASEPVRSSSVRRTNAGDVIEK